MHSRYSFYQHLLSLEIKPMTLLFYRLNYRKALYAGLNEEISYHVCYNVTIYSIFIHIDLKPLVVYTYSKSAHKEGLIEALDCKYRLQVDCVPPVRATQCMFMCVIEFWCGSHDLDHKRLTCEQAQLQPVNVWGRINVTRAAIITQSWCFHQTVG